MVEPDLHAADGSASASPHEEDPHAVGVFHPRLGRGTRPEETLALLLATRRLHRRVCRQDPNDLAGLGCRDAVSHHSSCGQ